MKLLAVAVAALAAAGCVTALVLGLRGGASAKAQALFSPAVLGAQPPGAVVLAGESRELAVALAVEPRGRRLLLVATVLGQDGEGTEGLAVSFSISTAGGTTATLQTTPGPLGTYAAEARVASRPTRVRVRVRGPGAGPVPLVFSLPPTWPPRPAATLVGRAERAYAQLHTLVIHEQLASDPIHSVRSVYREIAPNTLEVTSSNGAQAIIVGKRRWDRVGTEPWQSSTLTPIPAIRPFWAGQVHDATVLGSTVVDGRPSWIVSFAAPQMPAFFTVWLDRRTLRTLRLRMTAAAHFMRHDYGPFDSPLTIRPPQA